jgi:hypothetical protein
MTCESCWQRPGKPVCVDDDMETYLCGPCRKAVAAQGMTVEVMDL